MNEIETNVKKMNLRDLAEGTIGFNIKAKDTEQNQAIHDAFREFCKIESDNNYTLGISKLLEYYQSDFKYEMLYESLNELKVLVDDLKSSVVTLQQKPKSEDNEEGDMF